MNYKILEHWSPAGKGLGMDIWLFDEPQDKQEIVDLCKELGKDYDPVVIRVHLSKESFDKMKKSKHKKTSKTDYLAYYIKNLTVQTAEPKAVAVMASSIQKGTHQIRWMQERGKFEELFGVYQCLHCGLEFEPIENAICPSCLNQGQSTPTGNKRTGDGL